jgi:L-lysine exporter family protein LysE/ArgO
MLETWIDALALLAGLSLGAASLISLGPTNMMLIREGLKQGHVLTVSGFIFLLDLTLIACALSFSAIWSELAGPSQGLLTWAGVAVLSYFGATSLLTSIRRSGSAKLELDKRENRTATITRVSAVYLVNPLNYLEYLLVPAAVAVNFGASASANSFGLGLILIAAVNKFGFAFGARKIAPLLSRANMLPIFDGIAGSAMLACAIILAISQSSGASTIANQPNIAHFLASARQSLD